MRKWRIVSGREGERSARVREREADPAPPLGSGRQVSWGPSRSRHRGSARVRARFLFSLASSFDSQPSPLPLILSQMRERHKKAFSRGSASLSFSATHLGAGRQAFWGPLQPWHRGSAIVCVIENERGAEPATPHHGAAYTYTARVD